MDSTFTGRKISKGPRTIMLQIYVGSARDLSAKNNQNTKTARLILRKKVVAKSTFLRSISLAVFVFYFHACTCLRARECRNNRELEPGRPRGEWKVIAKKHK